MTHLTPKKSLLLLTLLLAVPARADGPVIPTVAVVGYIALIVVVGFALFMLLSAVVKLFLELLRKEKRNKIWIMSLTTFLTAMLFWYFEEEYDWMYYSNVELTYGYETRRNLYIVLFLGSALLGAVVGYFFTPKKKEK